MQAEELGGTLQFLRMAERLKVTHRSGYTSAGNAESVAEHSWRLCLMAMVLQPEFPEVNLARLLQICIVHDLGEAISGDIPAPEQARRLASGESPGKAEQERADLQLLLAPLPERSREHILELWDEYEAAATPEAQLAKGLDKLETILQHTQGDNPADFDLRWNLDYARKYTEAPELIARIRRVLDEETERRAREVDTQRQHQT